MLAACALRDMLRARDARNGADYRRVTPTTATLSDAKDIRAVATLRYAGFTFAAACFR